MECGTSRVPVFTGTALGLHRRMPDNMRALRHAFSCQGLRLCKLYAYIELTSRSRFALYKGLLTETPHIAGVCDALPIRLVSERSSHACRFACQL